MKLKCYDYADSELVARLLWHGIVHAMPDDVSFYNIRVYEPFDPNVKGSASGYFDYQNGDIHYPGVGTSDGDSIHGTSLVSHGFGTEFEFWDEVGAFSKGPPYAKGSFLWAIPWNYRVLQGSSMTYRFATVSQKKNMMSDGTLYSSKGSYIANNKVSLSISDLCWVN